MDTSVFKRWHRKLSSQDYQRLYVNVSMYVALKHCCITQLQYCVKPQDRAQASHQRVG